MYFIIISLDYSQTIISNNHKVGKSAWELIVFSVYICSQTKLSKKIQSHWILEAEKKTNKLEDWVLPFKRTNNFRASKTPRNYVVQQANFSDKETEAKKRWSPIGK